MSAPALRTPRADTRPDTATPDAMARALASEPVDLSDELAVIEFLHAAGWAWHGQIHVHLEAAIRGARAIRQEGGMI